MKVKVSRSRNYFVSAMFAVFVNRHTIALLTFGSDPILIVAFSLVYSLLVFMYVVTRSTT